MTALQNLKQSGFDVSLDNQSRLIVKPASRITETWRQFITANKPSIINELQAAQFKTDKHYRHWRVTYPDGRVRESVTGLAMTVDEYMELWPQFVKVEPNPPKPWRNT